MVSNQWSLARYTKVMKTWAGQICMDGSASMANSGRMNLTREEKPMLNRIMFFLIGLIVYPAMFGPLCWVETRVNPGRMTVTGFRKIPFPSHLGRRRILSPAMECFWSIYSYIGWACLAPIPLLIQCLPCTDSKVRVTPA